MVKKLLRRFQGGWSNPLDPPWIIHNQRFQETTHLLRREWVFGVI